MLTLDAGTGQNAISQMKLFNEAVGITGITLTKLDGTAKAVSFLHWRINLMCLFVISAWVKKLMIYAHLIAKSLLKHCLHRIKRFKEQL